MGIFRLLLSTVMVFQVIAIIVMCIMEYGKLNSVFCILNFIYFFTTIRSFQFLDFLFTVQPLLVWEWGDIWAKCHWHEVNYVSTLDEFSQLLSLSKLPFTGWFWWLCYYDDNTICFEIYLFFLYLCCKQQALAWYFTRKYWGLGTCTFTLLQFYFQLYQWKRFYFYCIIWCHLK